MLGLASVQGQVWEEVTEGFLIPEARQGVELLGFSTGFKTIYGERRGSWT